MRAIKLRPNPETMAVLVVGPYSSQGSGDILMLDGVAD